MPGKSTSSPDIEKTSKADSRTYRIPIILPHELFTFLVETGLRSLSTGGKRLSYNAIVRASLRALSEMDVDFSGITNEEEIKGRIFTAMAEQAKDNCDPAAAQADLPG